MAKPRLIWTTERIAVVILIGVGMATVIVYILRSQSRAFREGMDKFVPINPFKIADMILKADQEKYIRELHPDVQPRFRKFIREVEDEHGWSAKVTSGYRSFASQLKLHQQNPSNARPGKSHHNYGLAADFNFTRPGTWLKKASSEKDWTESLIPAIAKKHGISWQYKFGSYVDPVHFFVPADTSKLLARGKEMFGSEDRIIGNQVPLV